MKKEILRLEHVYKRKDQLQILDDFKLNIYEGEIACLVGLSGSGKSTLANILSGNDAADSGWFYDGGERLPLNRRFPAAKLGISCIYSESMLANQLTVAENLFVLGGSNIHKLMINRRAVNHQARFLLEEIGDDISPYALAKNLTKAQKHRVEMIKAVLNNARLIVMDSIDDGYAAQEQMRLKEMIRILKDRGVSVLYQSRKSDEVADIADRLFVMRKGKHIKTIYHDEFEREHMLSLLVEREFTASYNRASTATGRQVLNVSRIRTDHFIKDMSFELRSGEILGILDMSGKANNSLAALLTGDSQAYEGEMRLAGSVFKPQSIRGAVQSGLAYIPQGNAEFLLSLNMDYEDNLALNIFEKTKKSFLRINRKVTRFIAKEFEQATGIEELARHQSIRGLDIYAKYKILLYRWLINNPKVLVCSNPCAHVDIVMKDVIYGILGEAAQNGMGILLLSGDLAEVLPFCDRVLILKEGKIQREYIKGVSRMPTYETLYENNGESQPINTQK